MSKSQSKSKTSTPSVPDPAVEADAETDAQFPQHNASPPKAGDSRPNPASTVEEREVVKSDATPGDSTPGSHLRQDEQNEDTQLGSDNPLPDSNQSGKPNLKVKPAPAEDENTNPNHGQVIVQSDTGIDDIYERNPNPSNYLETGTTNTQSVPPASVGLDTAGDPAGDVAEAGEEVDAEFRTAKEDK